ncbi:MAG: hypothetical protein JXK07_14770 [Spirochaetes bacterium]|nr:hypothetical protein [Spirochaetota bacterium]MBN2770255.1 hypothetical protein [Spirochaetota bacterium]
MKKIIILFTCIILYGISQLQLSAQNIYNMGSFSKGAKSYTFGDNCRIRKAPSLTAETVDTLSIATPVTIISKNGKQETISGQTQNWFEISYAENKKGFIWGGLIAYAYTKNGDYLLLVGINSYSEHSFKGEARLVKKNRVISSVNFKPHNTDMQGFYGYDISVKKGSNRGLNSVNAVYLIDAEYPACGYTNGTTLLCRSGSELQYLLQTNEVSEAGLFSSREIFIFPSDKDGRKNEIIVHSIMQEYDEKKDGLVTQEEKKSRYRMSGKKITLISEEKIKGQ